MTDSKELQLKDSNAIEVVYDTSDPATQWRCQLYSITKPFNLAMLIGGPVLLIIAGMAPWLAASMVVIPYSIHLLLVHFSVMKRTQAPRLCTTSISSEGIRDTTPDSDKAFSWKDVKNIEFSSGDIYFFVSFREIFVPRSAFQDSIEAEQFYHNARMLWKQNNKIQISGRKPLITVQESTTGEKEPLLIEQRAETNEEISQSAQKTPTDEEKSLLEHNPSNEKQEQEPLEQKPPKVEQKSLVAEKKTLADYDAEEEEQWKQYEADFKKNEDVKRQEIARKLEELEKLEAYKNSESNSNGSE